MIRAFRRALRPRIRVNEVTDLQPVILNSMGITALILDLDGTLAPRGDLPGVDVVAWLLRLEAAGIRVCLLSNNLPARVLPAAVYLGIPGVAVAMKPLGYGFRRALRVLESPMDATAVVGDRVLTDILGGNRMGLVTVLVRGDRPGRRGRGKLAFRPPSTQWTVATCYDTVMLVYSSPVTPTPVHILASSSSTSALPTGASPSGLAGFVHAVIQLLLSLVPNWNQVLIGLVIAVVFIVWTETRLRKGHQVNIKIPFFSYQLSAPLDDRTSAIHYPIISKTAADISWVLSSGNWEEARKIYFDLLHGAGRCGKGDKLQRAALMVKDANMLRCREIAHHSASAKSDLLFDLDHNTPACISYKENRIYNCKDVKDDHLWTPPLDGGKEYRSFICVPVRSGREVVGVLMVDSPELNAFADSEEELHVYASFLGMLLSLEVVFEKEVAAGDR